MAVPKSRCSKRRQGNRESCKSLARSKKANGLKSILKIVQGEGVSFSEQFQFEKSHQVNSNGEYKGIKYREKKVKKTAETKA